MRKIFSVILVLSLSLFVFGCNKENTSGESVGKDHIFVEIVIKEYGKLKVELYPEKAPITVDNFVNLVKSGYYDNMPIHRVQPGFVIQSGNGKLTGKASVNTIKGEFKDNGVANDLAHTKGAISMARVGGQNDSASSQFFICAGDCRSSLDGKYAGFGYVVEGMDVVDKICALSPGQGRMGFIEDTGKMPVIESVRIIENGEG